MFEKLTTSRALLKPHVIDFILAFFFANSSDKSLGCVNKCRFPLPDGVSGENELSIQKECTRFPTSDSLQLLAYFA